MTYNIHNLSPPICSFLVIISVFFFQLILYFMYPLPIRTLYSLNFFPPRSRYLSIIIIRVCAYSCSRIFVIGKCRMNKAVLRRWNGKKHSLRGALYSVQKAPAMILQNKKIFEMWDEFESSTNEMKYFSFILYFLSFSFFFRSIFMTNYYYVRKVFIPPPPSIIVRNIPIITYSL